MTEETLPPEEETVEDTDVAEPEVEGEEGETEPADETPG
jgi:hypothetical protein